MGFVWAGVLGVLLFCYPVAASDKDVPDRTTRAQRVPDPEMFVGDEFIVVFNREVRRDTKVESSRDGAIVVNRDGIQRVVDRNAVTRFARQFPTAKPQAATSKYPDLTGHYKVRIAPGIDLDSAIRDFEGTPGVERVEKIGIHPMYVDPNDPYYRDSPNPGFPYDQWHYFDRDSETYSVQADLAWDIETGSSSVVVAVADSGVRYYHTDLGGPNAQWGPGNPQTNGNIFVNSGEIPGNGVDDDGNGYVDDTIGYDFVSSISCGAGCSCCDSDCGTSDNDPADHNGHGTHVSGTIGAISNNNRLVAGVAGGFSDGTTSGSGNGVKVLPLRIGYNCSCFGVCGYGFVRMDFAAEAFFYIAGLVDDGVNVTAVNCSWGSSNSGGIDAAVDALHARDVMVVHAAGNSSSSSADYLGNKAGVMNVSATDSAGNAASFTNYGSWVDVAAPGVAIMSTWHEYTDPGPDYIALLDGTSMSSPHVAGIVGLLESCNASLSRTDKFNLIVGNARPYNSGLDLGSGIANAYLALSAAGCSGEPECTVNGDCDDGNACTTDTCNSGTCSNTAISCDDGNACTADSCDAGSGCVNTAISCDDGNACTIDSCDSGTGCANDPIDCDDGDACTTDSCSGGVCNNDPISCDDGDACTIDSCNAISGCANDPVNCPVGEVCVNGVCEPQVCDNNGTCDSGEDCNNCPNDCISGSTSGAVCGNGICEAGNGEDCVSCSADCRGVQNGNPNGRYCCGDGGGQNPVSCSDSRCTSSGWSCTDVPASGGSYCCGDGVCESDEDSFNCAIDCGDPPACGDGFCDPGEDECNCAADCGSPPASETNCSDGVDEDCDGLTDCADGDCSGAPACSSSCGNGTCEAGEDCNNCSSDCDSVANGPPSGRHCCGNGVLEGPESDGRCDGNP